MPSLPELKIYSLPSSGGMKFIPDLNMLMPHYLAHFTHKGRRKGRENNSEVISDALRAIDQIDATGLKHDNQINVLRIRERIRRRLMRSKVQSVT